MENKDALNNTTEQKNDVKIEVTVEVSETPDADLEKAHKRANNGCLFVILMSVVCLIVYAFGLINVFSVSVIILGIGIIVWFYLLSSVTVKESKHWRRPWWWGL